MAAMPRCMRGWIRCWFAAAILCTLCNVSLGANVCPTEKRFRSDGEINTLTGRPYPRVLLYSYQGSGNTLVRTLVERATG
jgi:hypothetical protein